MQRSEQKILSQEAIAAPLVCPVCWSHEGVEAANDIVLSARAMSGRHLTEVPIYRCARWHLFALFNQPQD